MAKITDGLTIKDFKASLITAKRIPEGEILKPDDILDIQELKHMSYKRKGKNISLQIRCAFNKSENMQYIGLEIKDVPQGIVPVPTRCDRCKKCVHDGFVCNLCFNMDDYTH